MLQRPCVSRRAANGLARRSNSSAKTPVAGLQAIVPRYLPGPGTRVSCTRTKQASKPRLGMSAVQHSASRPKQQHKDSRSRAPVHGKHSMARPGQARVGLGISAPRPGVSPSPGAQVKGSRCTKQRPQPSKPTAQHRPQPKLQSSKLPAGAPGRPWASKVGKVVRSLDSGKRGGSAKPAKLALPKPSALPCPTPARQARRSAATQQPTRVLTAQAAPTPRTAATPASTAASGAEDDDPGLGAAGNPAGGDHPLLAQVAAPKATDIAPKHGEESLRAIPEVLSPPIASRTAPAQPRSPRRGGLRPAASSRGLPPHPTS